MKVKHCSDKLSLINLLTCISFLLLVVRVTFSADVIRTDDASLDVQSNSAQVTTQEQPKNIADNNIVINSIEDGLVSSGKIESDRHHYDQPVEQADKKVSRTAVPTTVRPIKPEPRNQQDDQQHQSQQDPVILDHRPPVIDPPSSSASINQDFMNSHNQATTVAPPNSVSVSPIQAPSTNLQSQYQSGPLNSVTNWYPGPSSNQQSYVVQPQQHQQQQRNQASSNGNYGSTMSGSNQVLTVAHPTSINSIINDHSQQQPFSIQPASASSNQLPTSSQPQQALMQMVNGQPVIVVNPNNIGLSGGRRTSISNWLRGISSMLANIFNRRDHGQLSGQASALSGNWIQLGPNAPHWLTQIQSAIQQQQYGSSAASSNRYTLLQGPQMSVQQQTSSAVPLSIQSASILSGQAQPNYQMGDLQASGSTSYVAIQLPPNLSAVQQPQQQSQPTTGGPTQVMVNTQQQQQGLSIQGSSSTTPNSNRAIFSDNSSRNSQSSNIAHSQSQQHTQNQQAAGSQPSAINQPWSNSASQQLTPQPSFGTRTANSDQNLPLAHYSRYSSNPSD